MRILIDIGHPGHVHYFRNLIMKLKNNGHDIFITARDRKVIFSLLDKYDLTYVSRGKGKDSLLGKLFYMIVADFKLWRCSLKFKPDLFLSFSSPYAAQVSSLLRKPHIALTDTEHEDKMHSKFTYPFTSSILTPSSYENDLGDKHVKFDNVIEGLYLHKKYFSPDKNIKKQLKLSEDREFVIFRFVSWNAHHDFGHRGLDIETKRSLINMLADKFEVLISSEGELPAEFKKYQIDISPEKMHDVLASATIFIGESATMASESVMLGTQAVYINSLPLMGYLKLEQRSGLLKHFSSSEGVVNYVSNLIEDSKVKENSIVKSLEMQRNFIDATEFLYWFIENYPQSHTILKKDDNYQNRFK